MLHFKIKNISGHAEVALLNFQSHKCSHFKKQKKQNKQNKQTNKQKNMPN